MERTFVWLVHRWDWGRGGDDDRVVLGICTSHETAREIARQAERPDEVEIEAVPLDKAVEAGTRYPRHHSVSA